MKEIVGISGDTCVVPPRWKKVPSRMAERTEWRVYYWKNLKIHFTFALRGKYHGGCIMANELEVTQTKLNNALNGSLNNASAIITKDYLDKLETFEILNPSAEDTDIDIAQCGKFYKLSINKHTTIVNVASSINCSIATVIRSDGKKIEYLFVRISAWTTSFTLKSFGTFL